ncbi:hypothetical protein BJ741DRAFT_621172 [Chytriomyces cf. hyalinus JEL632]|nr:hypothetical protein BJ741DRAFT_621172 [Chytriomyces cf. hyalinus JEL632]
MTTMSEHDFDQLLDFDLSSFDSIGLDLGTKQLGRASFLNVNKKLMAVDDEIAAILAREEEMQRQEMEKAEEEDREREAALQTLLAEKEREKVREMERKAEVERREAEEAAAAARKAVMPDPSLAAVKQLERKSSVSSISSGTPSVVPSISSSRSKSVSSSFGPTLHRRKSVVSVKATAPTQRSGFGFSFFSRKNQSEPNLPPSAAPSPSPMQHRQVSASPAPSLIPGSALSPDSPGSLSRETPLSLARDVSVKSNSGNARSSTLSMNVPSPRLSVMSEADTVRMSNRDSSASTIKIESRISRSYAESPKLEVMLPSEDEKDLFEFKF